MAITLPFGETISVLLEIGYPVDEFTLDSATFGALDTGSGVLDGTLAGDDVAEFVQEISVTRGRTEQLQQFTTGTCQITLLNNDRRFDPVNTSSPYFDPVDQQSGVQPRRAISVSVDGTMIFKGRITDIDIEYGNGPTDNSTVSIMAADDMLVLANSVVEANVTPAVERSDVRLGTLLDLPEISPTTPRSFETGTVDLGAYAITAGTNALTYAQKINESEQGYLFVDGAGTLNFKKRVISVFDSSSVSFADDGTAIDFVNVGISYGEELLFNKVIVAREGGSEQISDNPTSQASYGVAALSLTNMLLETDAASALLSADLLEKYGVPQYRFDNLVLAMSDLSVPQRASVLSLELADTVKVKRTFSVGTPASVQKGAGIQRITHRITPTQHSIQFGLEQKLIVNPLVLAEPDFPETRYNAAIYPSFESATLTNYSSAQSSDVRSATFAYAGSYSYETTMSSTSDSNIGAFQAGALALSIDEGTRTNQFTIGEFGTTITRTNLLPNPNMDNASVGTYYQAISITETRSTDYAYSGTYSLKGVIDTASSQYFQVLQTAGAMIDVTAGQTYTFSAYIYLPASNTANSTWRAQLFFWNGSSYTSAYSGTTTTIVRGNWTRLNVTATVPTGYYKALPRIMSTSVLAVGQEAYVDAWLLENTSNLLPYFDGTYADTYTGYTLTEHKASMPG